MMPWRIGRAREGRAARPERGINAPFHRGRRVHGIVEETLVDLRCRASKDRDRLVLGRGLDENRRHRMARRNLVAWRRNVGERNVRRERLGEVGANPPGASGPKEPFRDDAWYGSSSRLEPVERRKGDRLAERRSQVEIEERSAGGALDDFDRRGVSRIDLDTPRLAVVVDDEIDPEQPTELEGARHCTSRTLETLLEPRRERDRPHVSGVAKARGAEPLDADELARRAE